MNSASRLALIQFLLLVAPASVAGQSTSTDWAWKPITEVDSVGFYYIFYAEADNVNNGAVFKLVNRNIGPVSYRFLAVFKTAAEQVEHMVQGEMPGRSIRTGQSAGLFFVPFPDGQEIAEIGLKAYHIQKLRVSN